MYERSEEPEGAYQEERRVPTALEKPGLHHFLNVGLNPVHASILSELCAHSNNEVFLAWVRKQMDVISSEKDVEAKKRLLKAFPIAVLSAHNPPPVNSR